MSLLPNWRSCVPVSPTVDSAISGLESLESQLSKTSFSWEGEDVLAIKLFSDRIGQTCGCFVDIGAHHPLALSNTYAFYKRGWRGVNIEATPGSMEPFRKYRPEDIDLEIGVGPRKERLQFTIFSDPALNGFVDESTVRAHQARGITVRKVIEIDCVPVNEVLHTHLDGRAVDLLNLDIEGKDLEVLRSLDFQTWRPKMIILEILGRKDLHDFLLSEEEVVFLESVGYNPFSRLDYSSIFLDHPYV
jgi:FkbM family methyltransferase